MTIKMKIVGNLPADEDLNSNVEILKLSASSLKTFEQCQRKYYYSYIEKAPKKQWRHFDLGNFCHTVLEIFHKIYVEEGSSKKGSLNNLMTHSFQEARKSYKHLDSDLLLEARELITKYLDSVLRGGMPLVKGVETSFNFNLTEDIKLRGFLDRIDITKNGKFHIVDYKTTKNAKYLDPFQLLIYGLWLRDQYPDIKQFKGSYILLRHGSKLKSYDFNLHDIEQAEKQVIDFADKIRISKKENNWTPVPSKLCDYCDFNALCPAYDKGGW